MFRTLRVDDQSISEPVLSADQLQTLLARILDIQEAIVETHRLAVASLAGRQSQASTLACAERCG